MLATQTGGRLNPIPLAQIAVPVQRGFQAFAGGNQNPLAVPLIQNGKYVITLNNLPEITDTKSSDYPDENIIGRSFPIKVYSHSGNRQIGMKLHFYTLADEDVTLNLMHLRALQSAVYPDETPLLPYVPPPICKIRVGKILTAQDNGWLCVIMRSYNTNYPVDVVWHETDGGKGGTYLPYKLDVDLTWEVVFPNSRLPGQTRIFNDIA